MAENHFISSKFGGNKLNHEGYIYNLHKGNDDKSLFRCHNYQKHKYHGWAHLYPDGRIEVTREHTFPCIPAPTEVRVQQIDAIIRVEAANRRSGPRNIVTAALEGVDEDTIVRLPSVTSLTKRVSKQKRKAKNENNWPIPHSRAQIQIPNELRETRTDPHEQFLLFDTER